jgi:hypothetical protein
MANDLNVTSPQEFVDVNADVDDVYDHKNQDRKELDSLLSKMELPVNRRQARRPQDVRWLIDNLSKRNSNRPGFNRAWQLLLTIAERESVLKASELRRLRKTE